MANAWADLILKSLDGTTDFVDVKPAFKALEISDKEVSIVVRQMHHDKWIHVRPFKDWQHLNRDKTLDEITLEMKLRGAGISRLKEMGRNATAEQLAQEQLKMLPATARNARRAIRTSIAAASFTGITMLIAGLREYRERHQSSEPSKEASIPTDERLSRPAPSANEAAGDSAKQPVAPQPKRKPPKNK